MEPIDFGEQDPEDRGRRPAVGQGRGHPAVLGEQRPQEVGWTDAGAVVLLAPLAGPVFRSNHDYVMSDGRVGLARLLGVEITGIRAT